MPTYPHRKRYVGFIITSQQNITREQMIRHLQHHCYHLFGKSCKTYGIFLTRFTGKKGIVRCHHTAKTETITLLQSITQIKDTTVSIKTIGTSGTIKSLLRKHFDNESLQTKKKHEQ
ncbi:MAG: Rpp14/Pop5 family protein [Thermoplasmatota archaeon]